MSSVGEVIDDIPEDDGPKLVCVFCHFEFLSVPPLLEHCLQGHSYDLEAKVREVGKTGDDLLMYKLVNFLRRATKLKEDPTTINVTREMLADENWMVPVLEDDALLYSLGDYVNVTTDEGQHPYTTYDDLMAARDNPGKTMFKGEQDQSRDDDYFDSYKHERIHREMIEDRVRTDAYRDFIEQYAHLFKDKVVMDVGCGTGILSLFCARVGAKKVYAIDNSSIAHFAQRNVEKNGYSDVVQVICAKVEDFIVEQSIGGRKSVDIIISEWMGYGLLFEGMLDSVIRARDLYLKDTGLIFPSHCSLLVSAIHAPDWTEKLQGKNFWKSVYGFDFSAMAELLGHNSEISVEDVPKECIEGSKPAVFRVLNISTVTIDELQFNAPFVLDFPTGLKSLDALVIWFDTFFLPPGALGSSHISLSELNAVDLVKESSLGISFSTGPQYTPTHWHQAVLLPDENTIHIGDNGQLRGEVVYARPSMDARGISVQVAAESGGRKLNMLRYLR
ncbi:S-adenosyl-L-methionine-dependent methyltransferase [Lojkania enalia]|uniref:type I protein arginine methyltransferase n=1 Tax=Lojkania enalia TaxID=147567 RepID=A0A9P4K6V3_9PLEO|nr:S-adenosyl-L-methionine-dependent methyltransferase [Didymosphaeria enalia]